MTQTMIEKLNEFLRAELSAVETYDLALRKVRHQELSAALRQLRDDHDRRVTLIRSKLREGGAEPSTGSGAWGAFAKAVQMGADLLGDRTAIAALEEGEDRGVRLYAEVAANGSDPALKEFVTSELVPAQAKSHSLSSSLKRFVKAA